MMQCQPRETHGNPTAILARAEIPRFQLRDPRVYDLTTVAPWLQLDEAGGPKTRHTTGALQARGSPQRWPPLEIHWKSWKIRKILLEIYPSKMGQTSSEDQ